MNIFLIGFMGCGKSSVAQKLHEMTNMEVLEMDELLANTEGMSVSEIFAEKGESYFRDLETAFLKTLLREKNKIISCGGGTVLRNINIKYMKKSGLVVLLTASPETIYHRVKNNHDRPLLTDHMNPDFIAGMMETRRSHYLAAASTIIETDHRTIEDICNQIMIEADLQ